MTAFGLSGNTPEPAQINVDLGQDKKQERKMLWKAMEGIVLVNQLEEIRVRTAQVKYFLPIHTIAGRNAYITFYNIS